jgi:integrase
LVAYRHGLRASELVSELVTLRWDDIDLATGRLHVSRAKSGDASVHPISARESRTLRKLLREAPTLDFARAEILGGHPRLAQDARLQDPQDTGAI